MKIETESDKLWNEIKDLPINMFAIPDQTVSKYVKRVIGIPYALTLTYKVSAVIVALEEALDNKKYLFQTADNGYIIITRQPII